MVNMWRKAFCTSISRDKNRESKVVITEKKQHCDNSSTNQSPRISSKFGFFSNPSTPRCQSQPQPQLEPKPSSTGSTTLRCRTSVATTTTHSVPNSPKLQCSSNTKTPKSFSSPNSPSSFSFLKSTLRLSKSRCGICMQSVKSGKGTAIFTAECSHTFHFPCISTHVTKNPIHVCPVCGTNWKELPVLAINNEKKNNNKISEENREARNFKVYNDDEPLMSPTSLSRFNPIPESENETEDEDDENIEFQGFNVNPVSVSSSPVIRRNIEVCLFPETAVVSANRNYESYVVVLKLKALSQKVARRAPVDVVIVLDVGGAMSGQKLRLMKNSMRLVISSMNPTDRLSIVAFSGGSKRLLPLRRMTGGGQRSARRIVEALAAIDQSREGVAAKNDAVKKAAKVLEDRRERNSIACIIVLSDIIDSRAMNASFQKPSMVSSTRFSNFDVPVHAVRFPDSGECFNALPDVTLAKCISNLLNVVAQDVTIQLGVVSRSRPVEIAAVYSLAGRPAPLEPGSITITDLYAEEEKELLMELKVPAVSAGSHHVLTVLCSYRDPLTREILNPIEQAMLIPRPHTVRSSSEKIERLRNLHVTIRAVAESNRLAEHGDLSGAHHLLSSARALLLQSSKPVEEEYLRWLEAELQRRRQVQQLQSQRQRNINSHAEEKLEPLTPTSAWRAAERLAKVAIMRKSMNRVSDLHGFENARF
ncbi:probable E3 ubiquitin-protein ligase EDA40 [Cicer arietinum]|uniref:Probable E3 ubiquitin-protein ligase EDA40 n=1 Tax=Cicer arietinum TaxID=3827 RepID=A0A1S2YZV8_CICAR|nr:probable E3 ubiquitin-protein ligase EDA40 [Cicer arietinum]